MLGESLQKLVETVPNKNKNKKVDAQVRVILFFNPRGGVD